MVASRTSVRILRLALKRMVASSERHLQGSKPPLGLSILVTCLLCVNTPLEGPTNNQFLAIVGHHKCRGPKVRWVLRSKPPVNTTKPRTAFSWIQGSKSLKCIPKRRLANIGWIQGSNPLQAQLNHLGGLLFSTRGSIPLELTKSVEEGSNP